MDKMQNSEPVPLRIDGQESLTTEESSRLNQLEIVIEKGARSVGEALREISERKLYRAEYRTWKEYCNKRWGYHRSYAYRLIHFAKEVTAGNSAATLEVETEMSPNGDAVLPKIEGEARKRRVAKKLGKRKATPSRPNQASKLTTDLDAKAEFEKFKELVTRWENGLSHEDFLQLLDRVGRHCRTTVLSARDFTS
jgi:hypothetical protein